MFVTGLFQPNLTHNQKFVHAQWAGGNVDKFQGFVTFGRGSRFLRCGGGGWRSSLLPTAHRTQHSDD
jgi:hypothetical protein